MIFDNIDLNYALLPILVISSVIGLLGRRFLWPNDKPPVRAFKLFRFEILLMVIFLAILLLSLPFTAGLSTFGYPSSTQDIGSAEQLLTYLQSYNSAITRTTQVAFWIIIEFVILISLVYNFLKSSELVVD